MSAVRNSARAIRFRLLLVVLVSLVTADGVISQFLIKSGLGREGNPFLEPLVGGHIFMPIKVLGALACALILLDIHRRHPRLASVATSFFIAIYTGIVLWNTASFIIFRS